MFGRMPFCISQINNSQDAPEELLKIETGASGVVDINTASALLFVVIASCFLILLYKRMSSWFVELLVVLFCIGGVEVCHITFVFFDCIFLLFMAITVPSYLRSKLVKTECILFFGTAICCQSH